MAQEYRFITVLDPFVPEGFTPSGPQTKALLDDDEAILELLEDTLLAAARKDIAKGIDTRNNKSFFYRLVNEQANKVVTMFNNGEISNE